MHLHYLAEKLSGESWYITLLIYKIISIWDTYSSKMAEKMLMIKFKKNSLSYQIYIIKVLENVSVSVVL